MRSKVEGLALRSRVEGFVEGFLASKLKKFEAFLAGVERTAEEAAPPQEEGEPAPKEDLPPSPPAEPSPPLPASHWAAAADGGPLEHGYP